MIHYVYRARNAHNQLVTGHVQALNVQDAQKTLHENSLVVVSITRPRALSEYIPFLNHVSQKDKTIFARQLATMLEAGLTLSQALRLLVSQTKAGQFQTVLSGLLTDIQEGFSFSNSLAKYPEVFDTIFINVVRSGEATGKLDMVLKETAKNMEKDLTIRGKIKGALFYPGFILITMVAVGVIMTTKVIPQLKDVFLQSGKELPGSTTFLIGLSDFLINDWYFVLAGLIALTIGSRIFLRSDSGIEFYSRLSLRIPVMGSVIEQGSMARLARLLGLLLSSGVPLLEALRLINDSFTNRLYQRSIGQIANQVERGIPMSASILKNPIFPAIVGQMVSVGEQTGKMDEIMLRLAEYFESELETRVGALASLIEPFVIVLLGLGVAWLVQAILLPIYQISSTI